MTDTRMFQLIAESHKLQWDGMDYQRAAIETAQAHDLNPLHDADTFELMQGSPDEGCGCPFCCYLAGTGMFDEIVD